MKTVLPRTLVKLFLDKNSLFTLCFSYIHTFKVALSTSEKVIFNCFNESPLKVMKNVYFILKALFVLEIFTFLSWLFGFSCLNLDQTASLHFLINRAPFLIFFSIILCGLSSRIMLDSYMNEFESHLKMMKNAFYFMLKARSWDIYIFALTFWLSSRETIWREKLISNFVTSQTGQQVNSYNSYNAPYLKK